MANLRLQTENIDGKIILDRNGYLVFNEHRSYEDRISQFEEDTSLRIIPNPNVTVTKIANGHYKCTGIGTGLISYVTLVLRYVLPGNPANRAIRLTQTNDSDGSVTLIAYNSPNAADKTSSYWSPMYDGWSLTTTKNKTTDVTYGPDYRCRFLVWVFGDSTEFEITDAPITDIQV